MRLLKQSTAASVMVLMVSSTDHVTGVASATLTITASKNGAAFASISPTVNDRGSGWYEVQLTTAHTDTLGDLALHITATGCDPTDGLSFVVPRHLADLCYPTTSGRGIDVDATGGVEITAGQSVNAATVGAGAITATEAPLLANLDAAVSTRGTADPGDAMTLTAAYDAAKTAAQAGDLMGISAGGVSALLAGVVEGTETVLTVLRYLLAMAAGDTTGFPTAPIIKDLSGTKTRIAATLDSNGNRVRTALDGT